MINRIYKPDTIIFRQNLDNRCVHIEWHLILEDITKFAFFILKNNFGSLVGNLDSTTVSRKRIFFLATVKDDHICIFYHIHKNGFHVCHIHLESAAIDTCDLLLDAPAFRKLHLFKIAYQPHAIIFYDDTLWLMKNIHCDKTVCCKIFFVFDDFHNCIVCFQNCRIIFFFTFFTEDQKCLSVCVKIVLLDREA